MNADELARKCESIQQRHADESGRLWAAINRRAKLGTVLVIIGIVLAAAGSVIGYAVYRANGKAALEDLREVRASVEVNRERCRALEARQELLLEGQREMRDDVKKILDRLPR